jgi:hypothetical protein
MICSKCHVDKPESGFTKNKHTPSGLCRYCKLCLRAKRNQVSAERREQNREYMRAYRETHRERKRELDRASVQRLLNRRSLLKVVGPSQLVCQKCHRLLDVAAFYKKSASPTGYTTACRECLKILTPQQALRISERSKSYCARADVKARKKAYQKLNQERMRTRKRERARAYHRAHKHDPLYLLPMYLRSRLLIAVKHDQKSGSAVRDLGCSIPEFKAYIARQFLPGMSWDNWSRSGWHLDHIRPLVSFDLTDPEQLKQAVHYTNLRPLWAPENLRKDCHKRRVSPPLSPCL